MTLCLAMARLPAGIVTMASKLGSLAKGVSHMICDWIEMSTCESVLVPGTQPGPAHVPSRLRQTLPSA